MNDDTDVRHATTLTRRDSLLGLGGIAAAALQSAIDAKKPGDRVILDYLRDGAHRTVTVTLGTRPS